MENLENERWKPIKNYEGLYEISNFGRVKSLRSESTKFLKPRANRDGYLYVNLSHYKNPKTFYIHRIVAQHFIEKIECKNIVNHINEIRHDNRVENLEWCTQSENLKSFWVKRNGTRKNFNIHPVKEKLKNKKI